MRLIDADALKKDWHMGDECKDCERNTRECGNDYCFTRMDVCGMLDDAPTVNQWISVKDRLPEIDQEPVAPVIVTHSRGIAYNCGSCGTEIAVIRDTVSADYARNGVRYCQRCGKAVKW